MRDGRTFPNIAQHQEISMTLMPTTKQRGLRAGLLAGVCALALGTAYAQTATTQTSPPVGNSEHVLAPAANELSFANLIEKVRPAVVSVKVKVENTAMMDESTDSNSFQNSPDSNPFEQFFKRFGGNGMPGNIRPQRQFSQAVGSGFFISSDGLIVTNNHVIDHSAEVTVTTDDGKILTAKIVGRDPKTDLALLKVTDPGTYPYVSFAKSSPRVGDWVVAMGNPFGLGGTATAGIVSARGRDIGAGPYDDFLQIDAPVNKGNSGGPTFNSNGEVVGVNTAIFSPSGGSVGIAFDIPSEAASPVITALRDKGEVVRGYIGVQIQAVTPELAESFGLKNIKGALVAESQKNTPAAEAGVKAGDVITAVDGEAVAGPKELSRKIGSMRPNDTVKLDIIRDGKQQTINVKLAELPNEKSAKADSEDVRSGATFGLQLAPAKDVGAGNTGVAVVSVDPAGLGADQGIREGDVILEVAGKPVSDPGQVKAALNEARKDGSKAILMRLKSGDSSRFVALAFPKKAS
jgi:serine protease Do